MLIKHIIKEDLEKTELKLYSEKSEVVLRRYNEPDNGYFIAESIRVIGRAMDAGYEAVSLLTEERHLDDPLISGLGDITVYVGSEEILSSIAGYKLTGGALCLMKRKSLPCVEEVLKNARHLAVLEGINNPTNVGAIFRDAAALGADALLLTPDCSDPLYRRAARVSMGNVFVLPWCYFGANQKADIEILKRENFYTAAMALNADALGLREVSALRRKKTAVILGNENDGLVNETIEECDSSVMIPMMKGVDSLNVAAAAAVAFWELFNE